MDIAAVLLSSDCGLPVSTIAEQQDLPEWKVYRILKVYRPRELYHTKRPRKLRGRTSDKRSRIENLLRNGIESTVIAAGIGVSRQYVHWIKGELNG